MKILVFKLSQCVTCRIDFLALYGKKQQKDKYYNTLDDNESVHNARGGTFSLSLLVNSLSVLNSLLNFGLLALELWLSGRNQFPNPTGPKVLHLVVCMLLHLKINNKLADSFKKKLNQSVIHTWDIFFAKKNK